MTTKPSTTTQTRELEPQQWRDEFPTIEGAFYWARHKLNHEDLDVGSLLNGSLYFTYGGPTSKSRRRDYEYLGPIAPSDTEQVIRLREALESIAELGRNGHPRACLTSGDCYVCIASAALQPKAETEAEKG
jgi:hypothetical protein